MVCKWCGASMRPERTEGRGPHFAGEKCPQCGRHIRWIPKPRRVAIVGTREPTDAILTAVQMYIRDRLESHDVVISGGAVGVDAFAAKYARSRGHVVVEYKPEYERYPGKVAPIMRNRVIAKDCDRMAAFPGPTSTGTHDAIGAAKALGREVEVIYA